mgnify:CR=1 FL=1|jgi:hypothetical protein|nr:MAG TPA: hypothetical protein [Caudoviricetes sp.]
MEYVESNVYCAVDTKNVKEGARGYFADSPYRLKERVSKDEWKYFGTLTCIRSEDKPDRFVKDGTSNWMLFYPVDDSKTTPLTMSTVANLCSDNFITDTYSLLASCTDKVVEATKLYAIWEWDLEHLREHKAEFTKAVADLVCLCGAIAYHEDINLDKALTDRLLNDKQEAKVEKN